MPCVLSFAPSLSWWFEHFGHSPLGAVILSAAEKKKIINKNKKKKIDKVQYYSSCCEALLNCKIYVTNIRCIKISCYGNFFNSKEIKFSCQDKPRKILLMGFYQSISNFVSNSVGSCAPSQSIFMIPSHCRLYRTWRSNERCNRVYYVMMLRHLVCNYVHVVEYSYCQNYLLLD